MKSVSSARDAENHFVMLAQAVPTARTFFPHYPIFTPSEGVWGLAPMVKTGPCPFPQALRYA